MSEIELTQYQQYKRLYELLIEHFLGSENLSEMDFKILKRECENE